MSLYVDVNYACLVAVRFRNSVRRGNYLWNFSCPLCGDSVKNKRKARGYIYNVKGRLAYRCHNCGESMSLSSFLERTDSNLANEYKMAIVRDKMEERAQYQLAVKKPEPEPVLRDDVLSTIKSIKELGVNHPATRYCIKRKIPTALWGDLYFAPKFKAFTNGILPLKFEDEEHDHPRLIIPYFDDHGRVHAFQGRAFKNEEPKYYTIKIDEQSERVYGLHRLDFSKRVYAFEGPIDSMYIPNAIAVSGSSFGGNTLERLKSNLVVVFDNEPRNKSITSIMSKVIERGYDICIWPASFKYKDVGEAIEAGMTSQSILDIINENTYNGLAAEVSYTQWKKS